MRSHQVTIGRRFSLILDNGEDFFGALKLFFMEHSLVQAYIPGFIAGFKEARIVGASKEKEDKNAPVWDSVHLRNVEVVGCGTLAKDENGEFSPHIHVSVGEKFNSAHGYVGHLLEAKVAFLSEMFVIEVTTPHFVRIKNKSLYDVPVLTAIG